MIRSNYPLGTKIQQKNGRIVVKVSDESGKPKWEAEARRMWELYHGPIKDGGRVFLIRGVGSKIEKSNLTLIYFRKEKWKVLDHSRVLYLPTIRVIDKRTGKVLVNS